MTKKKSFGFVKSLCATAIATAMGVTCLASAVYASGNSGSSSSTVTSLVDPADPTNPVDASKYLLVWSGDQVLDDGKADLDFLAVIDATPGSLTYGKVVNTATMATNPGEHLLDETKNFLDNALGLPGAGDGDKLAAGVPAGLVTEAHHMNSFQHIIDPSNGHHYLYPAGLSGANIFACDITNPLDIRPVPGTGPDVKNTCGLATSAKAVSNYSDIDDIFVLPNGNLIATYMGAKGNFGSTTPAPTLSPTPPTLTTPGGLVEINPLTGAVVQEIVAVPKTPVPGHGSFPNGSAMLGPARYAPRLPLVLLGVDADGTGGTRPLGIIGPDSIDARPDTGLLAHPHGLGVRGDLKGDLSQNAAFSAATTTGIVVASDYADPVSLALTGSGADPETSAQNLGTTVRFWDIANLAQGPYAMAQMPDGPRVEDNQIYQEPEGLMAMFTTWDDGTDSAPKGMFVASMCGGIIYYTSDMTAAQPVFKQVYDFGACTGASAFTISKNNRFLIMPISGIQKAGDPVNNRDYPGEHDGRIVTLDIQNLLAAGDAYKCNSAPLAAWNDTPPLLTNPFTGATATAGLSGTLGAHPLEGSTIYDDSNFWPNNGQSDCPTIVSEIRYDGANGHPDAETTRGGPHFTIQDANEEYIATSHYFVDLREFAINGVDTLLGASSLDATNSDDTSSPPAGLAGSGVFAANALPGTGSVGDDTVCMMSFNRLTGVAQKDPAFNNLDDKSPIGCIDMNFADTDTAWPSAGSRPANAGNATPLAMTWLDTEAL